ncbi:MAG: methyl-accepting chemotaxis protein [Conexibacter sp.]|nr:methyl-accepting chemotaxis protein [Conexibacter sp.]
MSQRRVSVQAKLLGSSGLLLALTAILTLFSISSLGHVAQLSQDSFSRATEPIAHLALARAKQNEQRALTSNHILESTNAGRAALDKKMKANSAIIDRELTAAKSGFQTGAGQKIYAALMAARANYSKERKAVLGLSSQNRDAEAYAYNQEHVSPVFTALDAAYDEAFSRKVKQANDGNKTIASTKSSSTTLALVLLGLALLIGVTVSYLLSRSIRRNVEAVLDRLGSLRDNCATSLDAALSAMAGGDMTQRIEAVTQPIEKPGNDEIGDVARATNTIREKIVGMIDSYNASRESLSAMIGQVAGTAGTVSSASQQMAATSEEAGRAVGEIANAIGDVAAGSQKQVEGIDDARRLTDDVAQATARSAEDAAAAAQVAEGALRIATEGAAAVTEATEAMASVRSASSEATEAIRALGQKSGQIGGIVATITGIAEQTNLLALNAAIEAARAGDQGRGFAVVAEEVRKLAEESQQAAQSISSLIGEIQAETGRAVEVVEDGATRTAHGAATVEQARDAFDRIGGSVEDVTVRVGQIAAAVQEIAASATQMGHRMGEVAAVAEQASASTEEVSASTEQTSASTQEIAASSEELARTAAGLEELVAQFTLR